MTGQEKLRLGFLNLHDAFLNASLQRSHMHQSDIEDDPERFHTSQRGRFERSWVTFLYVLVEAWQSNNAQPVRAWITQSVSTDEVESLLLQGTTDGSLDRMRKTRHYMCHRDNRKYWDEGRLAVIGNLEYHESLHMAFSKVFLATFQTFKTKS